MRQRRTGSERVRGASAGRLLSSALARDWRHRVAEINARVLERYSLGLASPASIEDRQHPAGCVAVGDCAANVRQRAQVTDGLRDDPKVATQTMSGSGAVESGSRTSMSAHISVEGSRALESSFWSCSYMQVDFPARRCPARRARSCSQPTSSTCSSPPACCSLSDEQYINPSTALVFI